MRICKAFRTVPDSEESTLERLMKSPYRECSSPPFSSLSFFSRKMDICTMCTEGCCPQTYRAFVGLEHA